MPKQHIFSAFLHLLFIFFTSEKNIFKNLKNNFHQLRKTLKCGGINLGK